MVKKMNLLMDRKIIGIRIGIRIMFFKVVIMVIGLSRF